MSYTFDGPAKRVILTPGTVTLSVPDMWSRWVDWTAIGDNSKYWPAFRTVGRDEMDIPLYVFLNTARGWAIQTQAANHELAVTDGVLKQDGAGAMFVYPAGYTVAIKIREPGIAIGYSSTGGTGPTAAEIAAAVFALAQITPIYADTRKMNGAVVIGDGSEANSWRGVGVPA